METKDLAWGLFYTSGSIGEYLLYHELSEGKDEARNGTGQNKGNRAPQRESGGLR